MELSTDLIIAEFTGNNQECKKLSQLFDEFIQRINEKVRNTVSECCLHKYQLVRRDFYDFLKFKFNRKDLSLVELNPNLIEDFFVFLTSNKKFANNTSVKKMKTFKSVICLLLKEVF